MGFVVVLVHHCGDGRDAPRPTCHPARGAIAPARALYALNPRRRGGRSTRSSGYQDGRRRLITPACSSPRSWSLDARHARRGPAAALIGRPRPRRPRPAGTGFAAIACGCCGSACSIAFVRVVDVRLHAAARRLPVGVVLGRRALRVGSPPTRGPGPPSPTCSPRSPPRRSSSVVGPGARERSPLGAPRPPRRRRRRPVHPRRRGAVILPPATLMGRRSAGGGDRRGRDRAARIGHGRPSRKPTPSAARSGRSSQARAHPRRWHAIFGLLSSLSSRPRSSRARGAPSAATRAFAAGGARRGPCHGAVPADYLLRDPPPSAGAGSSRCEGRERNRRGARLRPRHQICARVAATTAAGGAAPTTSTSSRVRHGVVREHHPLRRKALRAAGPRAPADAPARGRRRPRRRRGVLRHRNHRGRLHCAPSPLADHRRHQPRRVRLRAALRRQQPRRARRPARAGRGRRRRHHFAVAHRQWDVVSLEPPPHRGRRRVALHPRVLRGGAAADAARRVLAQWIPLDQQTADLDRAMLAAVLAGVRARRGVPAEPGGGRGARVRLPARARPRPGWRARWDVPPCGESLADVGFATPESLVATRACSTPPGRARGWAR